MLLGCVSVVRKVYINVQKVRTAVLESVRWVVDHSGPTMSTLDRLQYLELLREMIREVIVEPDHWEQMPRRGGTENVLSEASRFTSLVPRMLTFYKRSHPGCHRSEMIRYWSVTTSKDRG